MKRSMAFIFGLLAFWSLLAGHGLAADLQALDRVSVHMDRSTVRDVLGPPDAEGRLAIGLDADIYDLKGLGPLIGNGCVYSEQDRLVGQAFVFQGDLAAATTDRLRQNGFIRVEERPGAILLSGKDDDTGRPILVSVSESGGFTTVVTFEREFYQTYRSGKEDR